MTKPDNVVSIFKNGKPQKSEAEIVAEKIVSMSNAIDQLIIDAIHKNGLTVLEVLAILNNRTKELTWTGVGNPIEVLEWLGDELKKP